MPSELSKLTMPSEFRNIVVCALRYAHTTDSPEISEFLGMDCDRRTWMRFSEWLTENVK